MWCQIKQLNISNFLSYEVVDCGSEAQLQLAENLNYLIKQDKGYFINVY